MLETLRALVGGGERGEVIRECRECGTNVGRAERCPRCDSPNVARYEID